VLISIGSVVLLVFGWLAGAMLIARSKSWCKRDKWIALCLPPGGYAFFAAWYVFVAVPSTSRICVLLEPRVCPPYTATQSAVVAATDLLLVLPLFATFYLLYRLWQPNEAHGELASSESS